VKLQAEISEVLLQRVKANISEMDDVSLMYAGIQAFREATPELRQRAQDVPHGGETYSFEVEVLDDLFEILTSGLVQTDHASIIHVVLSSLLLRAGDEEDLDIREGEGINSQVFGRFLVEREVVNLKMLMKALRLAKSMGARIGDLAAAQGWLNPENINSISLEQEKTSKPFGLAAIALGLLTQEQVYDLLDLQKKSKGGIGEALVQLKILSPEDMALHFKEFVDAQSIEPAAEPEPVSQPEPVPAIDPKPVSEPEPEPEPEPESSREQPGVPEVSLEQSAPLSQDSEPEDGSASEAAEDVDLSESPTGKRLLKFLTESFPELAKTIAGIVVKVEPTIKSSEATQAEFTAQMNMTGDASCLLTLSVSNDFARVIMWGLFGMDFVESTEMYPDAVGEFLNMLVGNASRSLEKEGIKTRGEAPNFECGIPTTGKCFQFVISGQIRGDDVHPVAPTATGTLFLSRSES
jgi:CheY-specific phosphatase CheX